MNKTTDQNVETRSGSVLRVEPEASDWTGLEQLHEEYELALANKRLAEQRSEWLKVAKGNARERFGKDSL